MFTKTMIALTAFLVVAGTASAMEWQPSWAPEPLPLVHGAEYRTGSPLSSPGPLGLLGGIANGITGGNLPEFTGGGSEIWRGASSTGAPACAGIEVDGECLRTLTQAQAQSILDETPMGENVPSAGSTERADCGYTFKGAVALAEQGIRAYDWCNDKPIEHAATGCAVGQRLWVTYVEDEARGVHAVYSCGE